MIKGQKYNLLSLLPNTFSVEYPVKKERIFEYGDKTIDKSGIVVYLCERELRVNDNFALNFAIQKSEELKTKLKIIHPEIVYEYKPKEDFLKRQLGGVKKNFDQAGFDFEIVCKCNLEEYLKQLDISALIYDFNPILNRAWLEKMPFKLYEVDGHNIVPARFISSKQEYNAFTFRKKAYSDIYTFMNEFNKIIIPKSEAELVLNNFIETKLEFYSEYKNIPIKDVTSKLSKYLNLGFISSQRVALEVIKSNASDINKEAFLEELIVRKELAENFCLYNKSFKTLDGIPAWARNSLTAHIKDIRDYIYTTEDLEKCSTHDMIWNFSQNQLLKNGHIHGYLRMYWAKKVLEWSKSPHEALSHLIYLNDKYSFDAPSPGGYVGILWSIGGLHDRAFKDWKITGKIRRMSYNSVKKKFRYNEI